MERAFIIHKSFFSIILLLKNSLTTVKKPFSILCQWTKRIVTYKKPLELHMSNISNSFIRYLRYNIFIALLRNDDFTARAKGDILY